MPGIAVWASDLTGTVLLNLDLSKKCGSTTRPVLVLALNGTNCSITLNKVWSKYWICFI